MKKTYPTNAERKAAKAAKRNSNCTFVTVRQDADFNPFENSEAEKEEKLAEAMKNSSSNQEFFTQQMKNQMKVSL